MDDGNLSWNKGHSTFSIHLYTNSFSMKDDLLLLKLLKHNFNINATLQKSSNTGYVIYIKADSKEKFINLIKPYICEDMKYKIGTKSCESGKILNG